MQEIERSCESFPCRHHHSVHMGVIEQERENENQG